MASVGTYLNFKDQTEAAFLFYQSIFGGEFEGGIRRFGDMPPQEGMPPLPLQDMFWGAYFGSCIDQFGIKWMFNYENKS